MILNSREDWNESSDSSSVELKQEEPEVFVKVKGKQEDALRSDQSSQADWIRQYMRRQEEVQIRMVQVFRKRDT